MDYLSGAGTSAISQPGATPLDDFMDPSTPPASTGCSARNTNDQFRGGLTRQVPSTATARWSAPRPPARPRPYPVASFALPPRRCLDVEFIEFAMDDHARASSGCCPGSASGAPERLQAVTRWRHQRRGQPGKDRHSYNITPARRCARSACGLTMPRPRDRAQLLFDTPFRQGRWPGNWRFAVRGLGGA